MRLPPFSEATLGEDHVRGKTRPAQLFLEHKGEVHPGGFEVQCSKSCTLWVLDRGGMARTM